jgi:type VII secretion-associated protein (TIGR03931 family)
MSSAIAHRAVIEAGPGVIRRLCCGTTTVADAKMCAAALGAIDDPVALVDGRPVAVGSLWRSVLRPLSCGSSDGMVIVHPSWWPASRVRVITAAARTLTERPNELVVQPRSWLLTQVSAVDQWVVVEIAERLVAISGAEVRALPRLTEPHPQTNGAEEVAGAVADMTTGTAAVVLIDAPSGVTGAPALAASIAEAVRHAGRKVVRIDDAQLPQLARLAAATLSTEASEPQTAGAGRVRFRARTLAGAGAAGAAIGVLGLAGPTVPVGSPVIHPEAAATAKAPTTFLVEGRVAVTVPASWSAQRVVAGPGSARVQVTSPSDPEVALHVTQSPVVGETLARSAERLKLAIDAEPPGVFVDFNPAGFSAGRPAVTYREVRAGHHVRWSVLLDGSVRISVGCQSRPGGEDAVRDACDQAVRSAHAVE